MDEYENALKRYKRFTGDNTADPVNVIIFLEKEICYYRSKIKHYDELLCENAKETCRRRQEVYNDQTNNRKRKL